MLERTFIHAAGVTPTLEAELWEEGARTWEHFLELHGRGALRLPSRASGLARTVRHSRQALRRRALEYFAPRLPASERWRLYAEFADRAAFVDIETTGLSPTRDDITAISLYDGERCHQFVRGRNLDRFPRVARRFPFWVTYNGRAFDLPFIEALFPRCRPVAHLDLRYPLRRLGYSGGLKGIERQVGLRRPGEIAEADGREAVRLWNNYERRGDRKALDRLLLYARYDVVSLPKLADRVMRELPQAIGAPSGWRR